MHENKRYIITLMLVTSDAYSANGDSARFLSVAEEMGE